MSLNLQVLVCEVDAEWVEELGQLVVDSTVLHGNS